MNNLVYFGYFSKVQGLKGQLMLRGELDVFVDELKVLFVEFAGQKAPYFISDLKEHKGHLMVTLEDVDGVEKAKPLVGKKVYIDEGLVDEEDEGPGWEGFELIDKRHGSLGIVKEVADNGHQVLLTLAYKDKEIILPLVDEFVERIDEQRKKIYFNAPEGLIDVYL